ncbi:hypothetical protein [Sulfidibacter corallicola]|uniref:Uncharacterized protein n=1 Tax=Sulfidibacter corallicola TaxID=2818388 RepID=A0A8A4TT04_SULCO|nr:hypothetical protein [Sulfidibacter corallicola]QTD52182.1 hypothetical protein J3U87_06875 [Sulfidibacter corallicola]
MLVIIAIMVFVRSRAVRDPEQIAERLHGLIRVEMPASFQPYSHTRVFGVESLSFWDMEHVREDGRTTNLFALYRENDWRELTLAELEAEIESDMEKRLARNEFHTRSTAVVELDIEGRIHRVFRFMGVAQVEQDRFEATSCFMILDTPEGLVRVQTLGLNREFDLEKQLALLATIRPLKP